MPVKVLMYWEVRALSKSGTLNLECVQGCVFSFVFPKPRNNACFVNVKLSMV